MNYSKFVLSIFFFSFLCLYYGCSDSVTDPNESGIITVEGRLLSYDMSPVQGKFIMIGDKSVTTDNNGKFIIPEVSIPYDLAVLDSTKSFLYKNVSLKNPIIFINHLIPFFNRSTININLPSGNPFHGKVIFTNYNEKNFYSHVTDQGGSFTVSNPDGNEMSGDVIVLLLEFNSEGNIIDYKNFGKKKLIVKPGLTYNVNFTAQDLNYKPETEIISGSLQPPLNQSAYFISFSPKRPIDDFIFESQWEIFSFVVPKKLPIDYSIVAGSSYFNGAAFNIVNGFPKNLLFKASESPELIYPEDYATNISKNSVFTYSEGDGHGIFQIKFRRQNREYTIVTNSNVVYFGDLEKLNFDYSPDHPTT